MSIQKAMTDARTPVTTTPGHSFLMTNRSSQLPLYADFPRSQVVNSRSSLIIPLLQLADFALEQERKARQRALIAANDDQAQALFSQAEAWAAGREELLEMLAGLGGGGR